MKMTIEIYKNKEKVNTMTSEDETRIYKEIAQILFAKEQKRATKTTIDYINNTFKSTQYFDTYKTQLKDTYTYKTVVEGVSLWLFNT